jgi:hypothetical protein
MFPNNVRRQSAGDLASVVAAHAVANNEETQTPINAKTILILRSPSANIAFGTDLNPHSFPIHQNSRAFLYPRSRDS